MRRVLLVFVTLWAVFSADIRAQGTLNLSRDLVRLGIATRNLVPNDPTLDARAIFQQAIDYAKAHSVSVLTVDPGNYYFLTRLPGLPDRYTNLFQVHDMTVDLAGSTIYFERGYHVGFSLTDCDRVTLTNFQIDYLNPPYTHVLITAVDAPNRRVSYATLPGWPDPVTLNSHVEPPGFEVISYWGAAFRGNAFVPATSRMRIVRPIASGTLAFVQDGTPWTQPAALTALNAGDTMVVTARGGGPPLQVFRGDSIVLSHIRVFGSSTWAVNMDQLSNSAVEYVRVEPRPGTGLVGSNADGIHFASSRRNNHIRHSFVTRTLDDGIAMDSMYVATALQRIGPRQLRVRRELFYRFPNGTALNFVDPVSTAELTGAVVVSQVPADSPNPQFGGQVDLTFDRDLPPVPANAGVVYGTPSLRGEGSTIEDNRVTEITGRGIWLTGLQGVTVRRNWLSATSSAGIIAYQMTETAGNPAPPVRNLLIESNVLLGTVGPTAQESGTQSAIGSIMVGSVDDNDFRFAATPSNRDVTIRSNYIADSGRAGIWLGELADAVVQDNVIMRWHRRPGMLDWGIMPDQIDWVRDDFDESIAMRFTSNVQLIGNRAELSGTLSGPVTLAPAALRASRTGTAGAIAVSSHVPGLVWTARTDNPWIALTSGTSGTGPGAIGYSISANDTVATRSGALTVAGVVLPVTQNRRFVDDPVAPRITVMKAVHVTELRDRIDGVRLQAGLPKYAYAGAAVAGGAIRAQDVTELRTALSQAYVAASRATPSYTDASLQPGTVVKAVHVTELRDATEVLELQP